MSVTIEVITNERLLDSGRYATDQAGYSKTDALDAHSIAVVAVRTTGLRVVVEDGALEALRMLADRRDELAKHRVLSGRMSLVFLVQFSPACSGGLRRGQ